MITDQKYINQLLEAWELTYKKGQLTFWILISLKEGPKYIDEIIRFMDHYSMGVVSYDEQSIYRALRKYYDTEIVSYELQDGNKGPQRKYYTLSNIGKELLQLFIDRNLKMYQSPNIIQLINQ